jgi:DNA polymerase III delta' subunit
LIGGRHQLPPAYLFYGIPSSGKTATAYAFARVLLCQQKEESPQEASCGLCASCLKVDKGDHPDLFLVEPDGASLKIDQFRELKNRINKAPLESSLKVVILDQVQKLTVQAANSILKLLEEPPKDTLFILIATNLFSVLPTIRSRVRPVYFMENGGVSDLLKDNQELSEAYQVLQALNQKNKPTYAEICALSEKLAGTEMDAARFIQAIRLHIFQEMKSTETWDDVDKIDLLGVLLRDMDRHVNKTLVFEKMIMELI